MGDEFLTPPQEKRLMHEVAVLEPFRRLNRVLEVGAGRGWFIAAALKAGWDAWALEINSQALERLAAVNPGRVIKEPAEDFQCDPGCVDVVRMWDVIEHLASPSRAVANIHRVLRPGGLLTLATTNFASLSRWVNGPEWVYLNGADHIVLFEPETIRRLLIQVGFTAISIRTRSFNLRRKLYHPERELPVRSKLLLPFRKIVDETIRLTLYGHQMIVTAVKKNNEN
ncbi:MAG: class I SAM-dependent methyltransferase [Desulfomonile sp.]|nr:class I SAM-dependent methyltransferase [Desulfomonile sp.]